MAVNTFGLCAGDVVTGPECQIRYEGVEAYPQRKDYPQFAGKNVLRFVSVDDHGEQRSPRTILLFPKIITYLVARIDAGTTSRSTLLRRLRSFRGKYPALAGVDHDYVNVARHIGLGPQSPDLPEDAPSGTALRSVLVRQGQVAFRRRVLAAYGARCTISGCTVASLLDAAHVVPFAQSHSNKITNGLLLRTDLHTLFDLGLLRLEPTTGEEVRVELAASLRDDSTYKKLQDKIVTLPDAVRVGVLENLRARYQ